MSSINISMLSTGPLDMQHKSLKWLASEATHYSGLSPAASVAPTVNLAGDNQHLPAARQEDAAKGVRASVWEGWLPALPPSGPPAGGGGGKLEPINRAGGPLSRPPSNPMAPSYVWEQDAALLAAGMPFRADAVMPWVLSPFSANSVSVTTCAVGALPSCV
jgi:hypothetical protein